MSLDAKRFAIRPAAVLRMTLAILCLGCACSPLCADSISVSGDPGPFVINYAIAGSQPTFATDATTTYSIQITPNNRKITGELDSAMPANTELWITLEAPTGATSMGEVILSTTPQALVTNIPHHTDEGGLGITYTFHANVAAGVIPSTSRTVTLTITFF